MKPLRTLTVLATTLGALGLSAGAAAVETAPAQTKAASSAPAPTPAQFLIRLYDQNKDGKISEEEFLSPRQKEYEFYFNLLDANKSGLLEESERKWIPNVPRADANADVMACIKQSIADYSPVDDSPVAILKAADTNNDGKLSLAEVTKAVQGVAHKLFLSVDANGNGAVIESELTGWIDQMAKVQRVTTACVVKIRKPAVKITSPSK